MTNNFIIDLMERVKMKTRIEIASELGICPRTLRRHLEKAGIRLPRGLVSPNYQKAVYELFNKKVM